jgi:hypothetical protein
VLPHLLAAMLAIFRRQWRQWWPASKNIVGGDGR